MKILIMSLISMLLMSSPAWAQSGADYRYTIQGYILDDNNKPLVNQDIRVYKGKIMLDMVNTDSSGYYSLPLLLRDAENGQVLRLRTGGEEADIRVSIDPKATTTSHVHQANFVAGKLVEGRINNYLIPPWIYPLVGLAAIGLLAVKLEKRRKRKIQKKKDKLSGRQPGSSHHAKKKRRKKH